MIYFEDIQLIMEKKLGHVLASFPRFIRLSANQILMRSDSNAGYRQLLFEGENLDNLRCDCPTFGLPGYGSCVHCDAVRKKYGHGQN